MDMMTTNSARARPPHGARMPGEEGIWVLIAGDLLIFSLFFVTFLVYRGQEPEIFATSHAALNQDIGAINTALMLSSSLFVAMAVNAARKGMPKAPSTLFMMALLCGAGFIVAKYFEYSEKISHGYIIDTNIFFTLYYVFTAIHLVHVVIGMGVLIFMATYARNRAGALAETDIRHLESGSCFWHVVDLLWIVLFALIYLVK